MDLGLLGKFPEFCNKLIQITNNWLAFFAHLCFHLFICVFICLFVSSFVCLFVCAVWLTRWLAASSTKRLHAHTQESNMPPPPQSYGWGRLFVCVFVFAFQKFKNLKKITFLTRIKKWKIVIFCMLAHTHALLHFLDCNARH